jgi:hypothetical protein
MLRRPQKLLLTLPVALLGLTCVAPPVWADEDDVEEEEEDEEEEDEFELTIQPYIFVGARFQGTLEARGIEQEVSSKLSDVAEDVQLFSLGGRVELWTPIKLGVVADAYYLNTRLKEETNITSNILLTEAENERVAMNLFAGYRFLETEAGPVELEMAALIGGAWRWLEITHEFVTGGGNLDRQQVDENSEWLELLVGLDVGVFFFDRFLGVIVRSELGGFGIGESPDLSWKFDGAVRLQGETLSIELGWLVDYLDLKRSRKGNDIAFEGFQHGPKIAFGFHF